MTSGAEWFSLIKVPIHHTSKNSETDARLNSSSFCQHKQHSAQPLASSIKTVLVNLSQRMLACSERRTQCCVAKKISAHAFGVRASEGGLYEALVLSLLLDPREVVQALLVLEQLHRRRPVDPRCLCNLRVLFCVYLHQVHL